MSILIVLVFFLFVFVFFIALEAFLSLLDQPIFGLILPFGVLLIFSGLSFITFTRIFLTLLTGLIPFGILMLEFAIIRLIKGSKKQPTIKPSSEETRMKINDL
ncbi:MAG: hypothetical protein ACLFRI_05120 [Candidatus Izemoplasmataceae bacterium]